MAPRFVAKFVNQISGITNVNVYYCKERLIADVNEYWSKMDMVI